MKASELKIRNLIQNKLGNIFYVSNLSLDIDDEYNELIGATSICKTSGEVLKEEREKFWMPIPLTEEWLVKFGFDITVNATFSTGSKVDFNVYFKNGFTYNSLQNYWWFNGVLPSQPKYVHQLQNLYFALTQKELELKKDEVNV